MESNIKPAEGTCIVCGSALVLEFWRGHPENRKVHCNDCGSEVTALMHAKRNREKLLALIPVKD